MLLLLMAGLLLTGCIETTVPPAADESETVTVTEAAESEREEDKAMKLTVSEQEMHEVWEMLRTPYKYGAVMKLDGRLCDSPSVFRYGGRWYMSFIEIDRDVADSGYESYLAVSDDLLHWEVLFPILKRSDLPVWDAKQCAAYAGFVNNDLWGDYSIRKVNGHYYFSYLGGNLNGYETDPLQMGECRVNHLLDPATYVRFASPVLSPFDADSRPGERKTIYKSQMFLDEKETLGHRYVTAYNAKDADDVETIFLAVSDDGEHWTRYGNRAVFSVPGASITGDPQILRDGNRYIMLYFVLMGNKAYNSFAVSYDLVHWTGWDGEPLIEGEEEWENVFAHKVSLVRSEGVLYHFYCAVNSKGERFIALATSKALTADAG